MDPTIIITGGYIASGVAAYSFGWFLRSRIARDASQADKAEISSLKAQAENDKIWIDHLQADGRKASRYLAETIAQRDEARRQLAAEKARDSARTAKGNRTRKINRLAREAAEQREAA